MTRWTVDQLLAATQGKLVTGDPTVSGMSGISLDSRLVRPREAFVAIRGQRFDAHAFMPEAIARGAACLIVSQAPDPPPSISTILVPDTVRALGAIAAFHRSRFQMPVIAVTGSCGKTTTKELIAHLASYALQPVLKTSGTKNNHIGLPLTLLGCSSSHKLAVVELGSNHPGEIAYLAGIARPTMAVITNIGPAHLEFFGSLAGVLQEKLSLLEALGPDGVAVVPGDQLDVLMEAKTRLHPQARLITFGISDRCEVQALAIRRQGLGHAISVRDVPGEFVVPLPGSHNVENALAALACVNALGIPLESVQERLASFAPLPLRTELVQCNGIMIINDCYNANPLSFARALEVLRDLVMRRKVVIAGDMLELGAYAPAAHQVIGRMCAQLGVEVLVAVGSFATEVVKGATGQTAIHALVCQTVPEMLSQLPALIRNGDAVLIKGSRKLQLEQATSFLLEHFLVKPVEPVKPVNGPTGITGERANGNDTNVA